MADPVTLLAFANDLEGHRYLRDLPEESRQLQAIFEAARRKGLCELVVRPNATLHEVFEAFTEYKDRVAIFHYGGHAGSDRLFLESPGTDGAVAHAEGLARFLGQRRNLELVFLNGCSTRAQAFGLLDAGIGAVISTARAIEDKVAREFAASFYAEIAAGATLLAAYEAARGRVQAAHGSVPRAYSRTRDLAAPSASTGEAEADPTDERGFPWELRFAPGAELERRWSLPEAAGNPLFGLPAPRVDCLPETPHRGLQPFTRRETAVFFGRSRAIRELYNLVTDPGTQPVILYYGPTGVGKSSVLAAGLLPRLELGHEVLYLRRDSNLGLLRTLRMGLAPGDRMDQPSTTSELAELWRACERPDRPLVVVLDQAEEAFTHPAMGLHGRGPDSELEDLLEAVRVTFTGVDPARRPRGKLILGFRNDWLDRFQQAFNRIKLGWEPMPLKPLDHDGIIEVIEGPARDPALKRHYQLTIAPGLAPVIANDLLGDTGSALAPTLQFLLTKMWTRANVTDGPSFDQDLYRALQHEGYQLGDMLQEGLKAVSEEIRESGLALDVLEFHTTEFDTAARRSRAELDERYPHQKQELDNLLRTLEEKYLLIETEGRGEPSAPRVAATRLAHDTLAPVVRREFQESTAPGQRARRLLENRAREWKDGKTGHPLDAADLATVEAGAEGMRAWTEDEGRLVDASCHAESRRQAEEAERQARIREAEEGQWKAEAEKQQETERRLRAQQKFNRWLGLLVLSLLLVSIFAGWTAITARMKTKIAEEARRNEKVNYLISQSIEAKKPQLQLILAVEAVHAAEKDTEKLQRVRDRLEKVLESTKGRPLFRQVKPTSRETIPITAMALISSERVITGDNDGMLRVWDLAKPENLPTPVHAHVGQIRTLVLSPNRHLLASSGLDGTIRVWPVDQISGSVGRFKKMTLQHTKGKSVPLQWGENQSLFSGDADGNVESWDLREDVPEPNYRRLGKGEILAFALIPSDPDRLWTASPDGPVRSTLWSWKRPSGGPWKDLHSANCYRRITCMKVVQDRLITGDENGDLQEYDISDLKERKAHTKGHTGRILALGYAPDPEGEGRLISAGEDGKVVVWKFGRDDHDVLYGHDGAITALAVENGRVYTSSLDGSVRSWDLGQVLKKADLPGDSARLIKQAQVVAGRNLSLDECKRFFPNDPKYHRTFPDLPDGDGVTTSDLPRQAGDRSTAPAAFLERTHLEKVPPVSRQEGSG